MMSLCEKFEERDFAFLRNSIAIRDVSDSDLRRLLLTYPGNVLLLSDERLQADLTQRCRQPKVSTYFHYAAIVFKAMNEAGIPNSAIAASVALQLCVAVMKMQPSNLCCGSAAAFPEVGIDIAMTDKDKRRNFQIRANIPGAVVLMSGSYAET